MNTSNPTLRGFQSALPGMVNPAAGTMTLRGTITKTLLLGAILAICFGVAWMELAQGGSDEAPGMTAILIGCIGALVLALIISFKPVTAPFLSPLYAIAEGFLLAAVSYPLERAYPGIVLQAACLSIATLFGLLFAYGSGLIRVNNTFRSVVFGATLTILVYYLAGLALGFAHITLPGLGFGSSWVSIGISVVIVIVAALNLVLDFDFIARAAGTAPKYMEWYGAFCLLVTIVWLYLEILRLLVKLRRR